MDTSPFDHALNQLTRAQLAANLAPAIIERIAHPDREIRTTIPVVMDNGTTRYFEGYRVQHSNMRGPYKGGIRFHTHTDIDEVKALALWMTLKTAVTNIPMGGGKGGVTVNPKELSKTELERLARGWVRSLYHDLGPAIDIPAPDVNTTPEIMAWMADEYAKLTGDETGATFTGKPLSAGGSEGRTMATSLGGRIVFDTLKEKLGIQHGAHMAIQGMGNVGGHAARLFSTAGYTVVAMSDSQSGIYDPAGLDIQAVENFKQTTGSLKDFPHAQSITNEQLLTLPVDVLIPAALENQITKHNADAIQASVILELANGPTTPEADDSLFARGIHVVPDILANAGGVVVSTFEWEQNLKGDHWSEEQVNDKLRITLTDAANSVWNESVRLSTDLRRAAFAVALERLDYTSTSTKSAR